MSETEKLNAENTVQDEKCQQKKNTHNSVIIHFLVTLSFLCLVASLVIASINLKVSNDTKKNLTPQVPSNPAPLPKAFAVYTAGTIRDQESRGTCWDFATMRFLEERYRVQGEKMGFLNASTFVRFSEQAHGVNMINFCKLNPTKCPDTPQASGIATDGYPSWIYHFDSYLSDKLVVDLATCPYTPEEGATDKSCPGMQDFQNSGRLKYNITNYKHLRKIEDIKRALVESNSSLPLVTELMWMVYYVPCDSDKLHAQSSMCKNNRLLCPFEMQNAFYNRSCANISLLTTAEAEFIARKYTRDETIGAHAMLLVGYNDEYAMPAQQRGGFIVQNSWGTVLGHSLRYLSGEISRRDEERICPNIYSPYEWVPLAYQGEDKWKLRKPTVLRLVSESVNGEEVLGYKPGHFHTADRSEYAEALASIEGLNDTVYYVINRIERFVDHTVKVEIGVTSKADPDQNFYDIDQFITLPAAPLDYLAFFFQPVNVDASAANSPECGYYFIPYDFVDITFQVQGLWFVDQMEVTFANSSYVSKSEDPKANGAWQILAATEVQDGAVYESHTPWLQNEGWVPRFK